MYFQSIAKISFVFMAPNSSPMQCASIKAINLINYGILMHNHGTSMSSSDELQKFESITRFKAEFLKQLLGDTEIERSETFYQSITVI
jgi:hypothetical protein